MNDEIALRGKIREAIRAGKLPTQAPERMWAGPGGGLPCLLCGEPVQRDEIEYELVFAQGADAKAVSQHVHGQCFAAWEIERRQAADAATPRATGPETRLKAPASTEMATEEASPPNGSARVPPPGLLHTSNHGTISVRDDLNGQQRGSE